MSSRESKERTNDALNTGDLLAMPMQAADVRLRVEVPDVALPVLRRADDVLARRIIPREDGAAWEGGEDCSWVRWGLEGVYQRK